jgi:acyl dehydratase
MGVVPGWQGRFFEDFEVGDVYRHQLGRTVSEADNTWFTPHAGIVTVRTRTLNQDGREVCSFRRTFYVYKRGAKQLDGVFPTAQDGPLNAEGSS